MNENIQKQLDQITTLVDERINYAIDIREMDAQKSQFSGASKKSFQVNLAKQLKANEGKDKYEIKADELYISEVNSGTYVQPFYEQNIKGEPFQNDLRSLFPQGATTSDTVTINRGVYATNSAAITSEGAQFAESTNTLDAVSFSMDKLAHRMDLSEEFLGDVSGASQFISAQIQGGLIEKMNANLITDVKANDTDFAAGAFANAIESANEFDVLLVALNQLKKDSYNPTAILLHPDDFTKISVLKATDNHYLRGTLFQDMRQSLDGVRISQSSAVTSGTYHVLDTNRFGRYYNRESLVVRIGFDGSDFSSDTRTAIAKHRGKLAVFDIKACVTGTFSNNKTALETS